MKSTRMSRTITTLLTIAIGYVTFFGAVFLSVRAEAEVRAPGTFVPVACGEASTAADQPVVTEVCMGSISGEPMSNHMGAFEFRDENGAAAVYRVTDVSNLLIKLLSGASRSQVFLVGPNGDEISMKIIRMADGSLKNASGRIGDADFTVAAFETVVTTL